jgi:hypothetical protein
MAGTSGSSQGTRRSGSGKGGSGRNPWQPFEDAAGQVVRLFAPENAMSGVNAVDAAGDAIEIIGKAYRAVGVVLLDSIHWDPRLASYFDTFGETLIKAAKQPRDMAAAIHRHEQDRINNVEEGGSRRAMWDIGRH